MDVGKAYVEPRIENRFHLTDRIRELAYRAAARGQASPPCKRVENQTYAYYHLYGDMPLRERQARSLAYALVNEPVQIFAGERINGIFYGDTGDDPQWHNSEWGTDCAVLAAERRICVEVPEFGPYGNQWPEVAPQQGRGSFLVGQGASPGHIAWNYDLILSLGVEGLMARHREALDRSDDPETRAYYEGVLICLEAMLAWNQLHVEELRRMLDRAQTPEERLHIEENIRVMERVPVRPAGTFREALQSFYFQWLCVMYEAPYGGNSPGRLDYFLKPQNWWPSSFTRSTSVSI
jgi:formate C-acetyltransferase